MVAGDEFVMQRRPDLPGKLAYPGKLQFLGGHADPDEALADTVKRELGEETNLDPSRLSPREIWEGGYVGEDKTGQPVQRQVGLYEVEIGSPDDIALKEGGELVMVPRTAEAVEALADQLTPFARTVLGALVANDIESLPERLAESSQRQQAGGQEAISGGERVEERVRLTPAETLDRLGYDPVTRNALLGKFPTAAALRDYLANPSHYGVDDSHAEFVADMVRRGITIVDDPRDKDQ